MRRLLAVLACSTLAIAGCGGDDDTDTDDAATSESEVGNAEAGDDTSGDDVGDADTGDGDASGDDAGDGDTADTPSGAGTATVSIDGQEWYYSQLEPGPDDDFYSLCTVVAGSLQAVMQRVDEGGNQLPGELSVILIEPGSPYEGTGDPPEVAFDDGERFLQFQDGDPIDAPADGSQGGGTVTVQDIGVAGGAGETFDATIEVSC